MLTLTRETLWLSGFVLLGLFDLSLRFFWLERDRLVCNEGIAWGIRIPAEVLGALVLLLLAYVISLWAKSERVYERLGLLVIFLGGSINALDRLFYGCVLDYFRWPGFFGSTLPYFNIADALILFGAGWVGWIVFHREHKNP